MEAIHSIVLKMRRGDTPMYARLKRTARGLQRVRLPVPKAFLWAFRMSYRAQRLSVDVGRRLWCVVYREPVFRSLCEAVGTALYLEQTPKIAGRPRITVGNHVTVSGDLSISAGHVFDRPHLSVGDGVFLGHRLTVHVARSITIEEGVLIAAGCFITDYDGHPSSSVDRTEGKPPHAREVTEVTIGRTAWSGRGCLILKGVTIGEGAIVGAGAVVRESVPPFSVAIGNPARVVRVRTIESVQA